VRSWQNKAKAEIEALLNDLGDFGTLESVEVREDVTLDHQSGDVYLTATVDRGMHRYTIYVYNDEAGVDIDGTWKPFELPDWRNDPQELLTGLMDYLRQTLGQSPEEYR
jgi:hypothetical protein